MHNNTKTLTKIKREKKINIKNLVQSINKNYNSITITLSKQLHIIKQECCKVVMSMFQSSSLIMNLQKNTVSFFCSVQVSVLSSDSVGTDCSKYFLVINCLLIAL